MSLIVVANKIEYKNFTQITTSTSMVEVASSFSFSATSTPLEKSFPLREGDAVEIKNTDTGILLTGYIDEYNISYSDTKRIVSVKGRSKTAILVDSMVEGSAQTTGKRTFLSVCKGVCDWFGLEVIDDTLLKATAEIGETSIKQNQTAFNYLLSIAKSIGVLLTDDEYGNLVITEVLPNAHADMHLKNIVGEKKDNNILSANLKVNLSKVFGKYKLIGEVVPTKAGDAKLQGSLIKAQEEKEEDKMLFEKSSAGQVSYSFKRLLTIASTFVFPDKESIEKQTKWEQGARRFSALTYSCKVQGFSHKSLFWKKNKLCKVEDDFAEVFNTLLIDSVAHSYGLNGSITSLTLSLPNAFSDNPEKDKITERDIKEYLGGIQKNAKTVIGEPTI